MAVRRLTPRAYRRITLVALVALGCIIVSGGAVRLTGSGLGCPDWPTCDRGRLVAPLEYHAMVEFVNRTVTGLVSVAVILAVLGSLLRQPRRRDLVLLSWGLVAGVVGQIVLGGLTVLFDLRPPFVMAHFLLSMAILANAVVLYRRAGEEEVAPGRRRLLLVGHELRRLGQLVLATAGVAVFLGTVVTAAGPHGGDETAERLDVSVHRVAQLHGTSVVLLLTMTVALIVLLRREGAPPGVQRRASLLLVTLVGQAGIGWLQYLTGVPALLVGAHIAGAVVVWVAALVYVLGTAEVADGEGVRGPAPERILVTT